jgi:long-chain acyl-CoA synthetase
MMAEDRERNLVERFDAHGNRLGTKLAVRESDRDWTFAELSLRSHEISDALSYAGVGPADCVALMLPNSGAFVASFFAIARVGCVIAPLNVRYQEQELVYFLRDTSAVAIVAASDLAPRVRSAFEKLEHPPALFEVNCDGTCRPPQPGRRAPASEGEVLKDPILLHQYTSGSTGAPKRIRRTNGMLRRELGQLTAALELTPDDRLLGVAPFSHVNGLVRTMLASMYVGAALYPLPEFKRRGVLDLITREQISYFGGVPSMYAILADTPLRGNVDLASLRIAFSASAPLRPSDNERFGEKYGVLIRQLYGSTETGTISVNLESDIQPGMASVGHPLEGVDVAVLDEAGQHLPPNGEGEFAVRSPWAISEYHGNLDATGKSFQDGWYRSGDLGFTDDCGRLTLTGRLKFLINRGGYKINPNEVEEAIQSHPKISEVVVLGAPTRHGDELVRCVAVASAPCTAEEIVEHCRSRIADFKIPSRIEFRDALPRSETGKMLRGKL